jgi:chromosome segregation ATPase
VKKLTLIALLAIGLVALVGADVIKSSVGSVRSAVRDALTAEVPLGNQLAEAQAQVDVYAESIIRGEVAAENLQDMIAGVEREIRTLSVRVGHEREALASLRAAVARDSETVPTSLAPVRVRGDEQRGVLRRVREFQATSELLTRRTRDLERLRAEYASTQESLATAHTEQSRLAEEVRVLAAELESLEARKAAARTRNAVGDSSVASSGFAEAQERIKKIRAKLSEQNKLLQYYDYKRVVQMDPTAAAVSAVPTDPVAAIDEALAAYPGN